MKDVFKNIEKYNPGKKRKTSKVFDDMTADVISSKKHNSVVTELFIRDWKLNISLYLLHNYILRYLKMLD